MPDGFTWSSYRSKGWSWRRYCRTDDKRKSDLIFFCERIPVCPQHRDFNDFRDCLATPLSLGRATVSMSIVKILWREALINF